MNRQPATAPEDEQLPRFCVVKPWISSGQTIAMSIPKPYAEALGIRPGEPLSVGRDLLSAEWSHLLPIIQEGFGCDLPREVN